MILDGYVILGRRFVPARSDRVTIGKTLFVGEVAQRLGITRNRVAVACAMGRFPGAYLARPTRHNGSQAPRRKVWHIPESSLPR